MKNLCKRGLIPFHYDRKPAKQTTTRTLARCATELITAVKGFFIQTLDWIRILFSSCYLAAISLKSFFCLLTL